MAERSQRTRLVPQFDDDEGWRFSGKARQLSLWAGAALAAVAMAFAAASTESGSRRLSQPSTPEPSPLRMTQRQISFETDLDTRRISDAIRSLAADRDRLQARISTLEHLVEDATGAIPGVGTGHAVEVNAAATPSTVMAYAPSSIDTSLSASPVGPPPTSSRAPLAAINELPRSNGPVGQAANRDSVATSEPTGPIGSVATKTEFGVDLGSAPSMAGLRTLWQSLKDTHEPLFEGLRPVMALREGTRPGTIELRLVAGPLANAGAAARLCAALSVAGLVCQATVFDGQRLALK